MESMTFSMAMLDYQKAMEGKHGFKNQLLLSISEDLKGPVLKDRISLLKYKGWEHN